MKKREFRSEAVKQTLSGNSIGDKCSVLKLKDCSQFTVHSSLNKAAFTLAEVLITLGVIGVVAAVALPALLLNIQEKVQKEQLRSAKYKLTKATDKMKSLGLLDGRYDGNNSTKLFIDELQKHLKIMKRCDNSHLSECWPTSTIELPTGSASSANVNSLTTGAAIKALALGTKNTKAEAIVTADGTPMILVYGAKCEPLDVARTYSWSTIDNKPETNATTNCISAIIDINGKKGPNKLGKDVRTLNSLYGSVELTPSAGISKSECKSLQKKIGINNCSLDDDYWAAAVKKCYELGLHLPSEQTLAAAAGARYGRTDITPTTVIASEPWLMSNSYFSSGSTCKEKLLNGYTLANQAICISSSEGATNETMNLDETANAAISLTNDAKYVSNTELGTAGTSTIYRFFRPYNSGIYKTNRSTSGIVALCVAD